MKAPEWVIEMMKTGEPVKCITEEGSRIISVFDVRAEVYPYYSMDNRGEWFREATPIKPPTVRPFRTVEEVEPFFGKVAKFEAWSGMITGASIMNGSLVIYIGSTIVIPDDLMGATFPDGSPVGITE